MNPPAVLARLFAQFPLATHPPVVNSTSGLAAELSASRFYFQGDVPPSAASFVLGCHNVTEYRGKLVPTDPMSLTYAVVLCHKNGLKLPSRHANKNAAMPHYIMKMSLFASPDRCLPILIEEDNVNRKREIRSLVSMERSTSTKSFSRADEALLNDHLDGLLSDVWFLCLWFEKESIDLEAIFGHQGGRLATYDLYNEIPHWKSFTVRYPVLKQSVYAQKLKDLRSTLELCSQETNKIINIKIECFLIHVRTFLSDTQLDTVTRSFALQNILDEY